jgi:methylmalonyl-CoA/ethylmalonyl-CoA epimerase
MKNPVFTETMQIGIVVRDLDAAIRHYEEDFGIGPWNSHQFTPEEVKEWQEHGKPVKPAATRFAAAMVGRVQWELIQPLDDTSIFAQFLAEKGEGVHHIAVATPDYEQTLADEAKRGNELMMSCVLGGQYDGIKVAYLGTQPNLGVTLEVFNFGPGDKGKKSEQ